jgi:hypothetical protein
MQNFRPASSAWLKLVSNPITGRQSIRPNKNSRAASRYAIIASRVPTSMMTVLVLVAVRPSLSVAT